VSPSRIWRRERGGVGIAKSPPVIPRRQGGANRLSTAQ
jgi:hypothetical protein